MKKQNVLFIPYCFTLCISIECSDFYDRLEETNNLQHFKNKRLSYTREERYASDLNKSVIEYHNFLHAFGYFIC